MKGVNATELRKKTSEELLTQLKNFREELQNIRFTKVSGTAVSKLSKIKTLRRAIARTLTIINDNNKNKVIEALRKRTTTDSNGNTVENVIRNIKSKHLPTNLRPKKTRAQRKALTKAQSKRVNVRILKKRLNFPVRKFAVPL